MEKSSIELKLKRMDRVYRPDEMVEGVIVVNAYKGWQHTGIKMFCEGMIHMNNAGRGIALQKDPTSKPINILRSHHDISQAGKFADGVTEIPFEFQVKPAPGQVLLESYHGVYVSILYTITVICERGVMKKDLRKDMEFLVEIPNSVTSLDPLPVQFDISPESLENVSQHVLASIPKFKISGKLHKSKCPINQPLTGEVVVEQSLAPIRSVELQLVRVETVNAEGKCLKEATEIQNIQIGDGNICKNLTVPMYMVFPRLFSCPTVLSALFKIEFEVNLVIVFSDGYMITENFPLVLYRDQ